MAITRWNSLSNLFGTWPSVWEDQLADTNESNLNIYETKDNIVVQANVAGVNQEDIDLTFEKGVLWIQAQQKREEKDDKKKTYRKASWSYSYRVAVPGNLDYKSEPEAELEQGVLTIKFKKSEADKPKKLTIKTK